MKKASQKRFSLANRIKGFGFAINGIVTAFRTQHNIWVQVTVAFIVIAGGFWFGISLAEWLFIVFAIGLVLSAEVFNSAIEMFVDIVSPDFNKKAGLVKDMAAGAVLIAAITAAIIGLMIFVPRILVLL